MAKFNSFKSFSKCALAFFLFTPCHDLFAQDNGQIININQNFQIAFTDLGSRVLNRGDIVKVSLNADEFLYLQVLESSAILSKLGPCKVEGFQTNLSDFQRMAVGNEVVKINQTQEKVDGPTASVPETDNALEPSALQIQKLEDDLAHAKAQIKLLEESNERIAENQTPKQETAPQEQTGNSKEILEQLKTHLDNMSKLLNLGN